MTVAGCTPVAPRRQRTARAHLRRVRQRRPLELARLEEAVEENGQPPLDHPTVVLRAPLGWYILRPVASVAVAPGVLGEKDDAARSMAEAADVVEEEVLQLERANRRFADLRRLSGVLFAGNQLWRDLGFDDRLQDPCGRVIELPAADHPTDQVLDERLGDRRVNTVVRHLVANAVGTPTEREFAEVAGADDERLVLVC